MRSQRRKMRRILRRRKTVMARKGTTTKTLQVARRMLKVTETKLKAEKMERPKKGKKSTRREMKMPKEGRMGILGLWLVKSRRLEM